MKISEHIIEHEVLGTTKKLNDTANIVSDIATYGEYSTGGYTNAQAYLAMGTVLNNTSTFTGFGGPIGTPQNFDTVVFSLINRDTTAVTQIRYILTVFNRSGTVLVDRTVSCNYPVGETLVTADLGTVIANEADAQMFFTYQTEKLCSMRQSTLPEVANDINYGRYVYSITSDSMTKDIATFSRPTAAAVTIWATTKLSTTVSVPILTTDLVQYNELMQGTSPEWLASFERVTLDTPTVIGEYVTYSGLANTFSTFSGWGGPMGSPQGFNRVDFRVKNRATSGTITRIDCYITVFNKDGLILYLTSMTVSLAAGSDTTISWNLSETCLNTADEELYFSYQTNQIIDQPHGHTAIAGDNTNGLGRVSYKIGGAFGAPSSQSNSVVATETNWTKCYCTQTAWGPTDQFVGLLGDIAATPPASSVTYTNTESGLVAENVQTAIDEVAASLDSVYVPIRVILPDVYHAIVGDTLQLFYRGIVEAPDPFFYNIEVIYDGNNGKAFPRYFELLPIADDVGTHTLTINVRDSKDTIIGTNTCDVVVKNIGTSPASAVNILCIGDSLTQAGEWVIEARRRLVGAAGTPAGHEFTNFNFIGTVAGTGLGWEAYGGRSWLSYITEPSNTTLDMWAYVASHDKDLTDQHSVWADANGNHWDLETYSDANKLIFTRAVGNAAAMPTGSGTLTHVSGATHTGSISYTSTAYGSGNPFWDPGTDALSLSAYCNRNGYSGIDYVYTLLTWNASSSYRDLATDHATQIGYAKTFLNQLHLDYPNCKVKLMGIQIPSVNGGLAVNYGASGDYSNYYGLVRTVMGYNLALQALANEEGYSDFVEFINISGQFDSDWNMPYTTKAVNTRNTTTELKGTNGVHPSLSGYKQIADAAYRSMMSWL